ncbi:Uncharacterised protein [Citrobacter braakii]|uniref:Uncharacterized protein n=1 Tax=Yersinia aleksiciae TaxID=263819 RepID=A0A0T9URL9_YERAE|nr:MULTISPECIES: hypothetical protein [Enterobacterales]AIN14514.1 hypothetical protein DJ40_1116 [Yersinia pseudotuberculosis]CNB56166.1 Uncharacterised protein [Yersinia enterocolitica]CNL61611.1 Uncharacterised protein [Yersinia aleksiciae]STH94193.1 Uncharacterised protein [Citrobacter braakii]SUP90542.1 Uncharacterised protein [Yersinia pseudotuberculosis]
MTVQASLGGRRLLGGGTYLIPPSEILSLSVTVTPDVFPKLKKELTLNLNIHFDDSAVKQSVAFKPEGENTSRMTLYKWDNSLSTALNKLYPIMNIEGKTVQLMLSNIRIGETNSLTAQFWIDKE